MILKLSGRWKKIGWCVFALGISAITTVEATDLKVGFVNVSKILEVAPQADVARKLIEEEFSPKDRDLIEQQKTLRQIEDQLIRDREVIASSERINLERQIRNMKRDIRRQQEEFREDLNIRRNQELGKLQRKVISTIRALAEVEGYDLIISDGVLYASSRVDITEKILTELREFH